MTIATLREAVTTMSVPPHTIARWSCPTDSTGLIEFSLPTVSHARPSYVTDPKTLNTGKAYAIELDVFAFSCDSADFDIQILNRNDESLVDSIYEVIKYTNINLSQIDQDFSNFVIKNCDIPVMRNKLYIKFTDNSGVGGGLLNFQLTYITLQDRLFENIAP